MLKQCVRCSSCGAVTDPDEDHCPVGCANNGKMENIFLSEKEMIRLLTQKKVWTKWPGQLKQYYKEIGLL